MSAPTSPIGRNNQIPYIYTETNSSPTKFTSPLKRSLFSQMDSLAADIEMHKKARIEEVVQRQIPVAPQILTEANSLQPGARPRVALRPPETPCKPKRGLFSTQRQPHFGGGFQLPPSRPVSPHVALFNAVEETMSLPVNGVNATLNKFAKGSLMQAYTLQAESQIYPNFDNDQLIVKLPFIDRNTPVKKLPSRLQCAIESYRKMQAHGGIPTATLVNLDTAGTDNFFVVEKIPHPVDMTNPSHLEQIKALFQVYFKDKLLLDLSFDNVRVKKVRDDVTGEETDVVYVIDYIEKEIDFVQEKVSLGRFVINNLESFCRNHQRNIQGLDPETRWDQMNELLSFLTEGLEGTSFNPNWRLIALNTIFSTAPQARNNPITPDMFV